MSSYDDTCDSRHGGERCTKSARHGGEHESRRYAWRLLAAVDIPALFGPPQGVSGAGQLLALEAAHMALDATNDAVRTAVAQRDEARALAITWYDRARALGAPPSLDVVATMGDWR